MSLKLFKHLLPNARAWRITTDKQLRQFFVGLSGLNNDITGFFDNVWLDIFPQTTREIQHWEQQLGIPNTIVDEQERRDRLAATWKAMGGQNPRYIENTLRAAGFDVYVHQWWEPGTEPAIGVHDSATARDPFLYLNDGLTPLAYVANDGGADMQDGDLLANDGGTANPTGYPLVNKIKTLTTSIIGDGSAVMTDGNAAAQDGGNSNNYAYKQYQIPADPTKYAYFLYIGGKAFPNHANVSQSRRNEFETLCLKICPTQQWLGILVDYS